MLQVAAAYGTDAAGADVGGAQDAGTCACDDGSSYDFVPASANATASSGSDGDSDGSAKNLGTAHDPEFLSASATQRDYLFAGGCQVRFVLGAHLLPISII